MGNEDERRTASARVVRPARIFGSGASSSSEVPGGGVVVHRGSKSLRTCAASGGEDVVESVPGSAARGFDFPPHAIAMSIAERTAVAGITRDVTGRVLEIRRRVSRCTRRR